MLHQILATKLLEGRFEIQRTLGVGGFGVVVAARDIQLNRDVAIKFVKIADDSESNTLLRFQREAKILAQLEHKHLVTVYSSGVFADRYPYIVMECAAGTKLRELIIDDAISDFDMLRSILIQICEGLDYAHRNGVVHRDLTPSNICVAIENDKAEVKLIDFGLAHVLQSKAADKLTRTGVVVGNVFYMSPEQCRGLPADARSDIYALGCILYEILSGDVPISFRSGPSPLAGKSHAILNKMPDTPSVRPQFVEHAAFLKDLTLRCLQKAPSSRFSSCAEILECLKTLKAPSSRIANWSTVNPSPSDGLNPKQKAAFVGVAAVAMLAVGGLVLSNDSALSQTISSNAAPLFVQLPPPLQLRVANSLTGLSRQRSAAACYKIIANEHSLPGDTRIAANQSYAKLAMDNGDFDGAAKAIEQVIMTQRADNQGVLPEPTLALARRWFAKSSRQIDGPIEAKVVIFEALLDQASGYNPAARNEVLAALQREITGKSVVTMQKKTLEQISHCYAHAISQLPTQPDPEGLQNLDRLAGALLGRRAYQAALEVVSALDKWPNLALRLTREKSFLLETPDLFSANTLSNLLHNFPPPAEAAKVLKLEERPAAYARVATAYALLGDEAQAKVYSEAANASLKTLIERGSLSPEYLHEIYATYRASVTGRMQTLTERKGTKEQWQAIESVANNLASLAPLIEGKHSLDIAMMRFNIFRKTKGEKYALEYLNTESKLHAPEFCDVEAKIARYPDSLIDTAFYLFLVAQHADIKKELRTKFFNKGFNVLYSGKVDRGGKERILWTPQCASMAMELVDNKLAASLVETMLNGLKQANDPELAALTLTNLANCRAFALLTVRDKETARLIIEDSLSKRAQMKQKTVQELESLRPRYSA